jgi:CHRD domain-containing protein
MFRLKTVISLFATGATLALAAPANAAVIELTATLNAAQEVQTPAVNSTATGTGTFQFNDVTKRLTYHVTFTGLTPTAGHFHGPAAAGSNAGVQIALTDLSSPIEGMTDALNATQEGDLLAGRWYVNLHTSAFPNGEIRGQVLRQAADGGTDASDAGDSGSDAGNDAADSAGGTAGGGTGGTAGAAGRGGTGGAAGRGGTSGASGAGGSSGRGGAAGSGGRGGSGGSGASPAPADEDDGCSCRTVGGSGSTAGFVGLAFAGLMLSRRISQRRSRRG